MAQNLLPQSALPIGQTPLQTIQAPRVQVNIPNPLDVSSFFKMQQGQQNNLGILQRNEQLKLQRQELDLRKYETMVREMESIMNLANNGFGEFYDNKAQQRSANKSTGVDAFSNLNPFYAKHAEIIDRNQGIYDSAQKKLDEMGMSFLTSGSTDPAARFEVSRGMNNVITDTMRQVKRDPEYVKYSTMHMAYNKWLDEINKRKNNGDYVDVRAVDEMEAKYTAWANGDDSVGEMSLSQFNPDKYVFKADVLKDMAADSKLLSTGVEQFEEIETTGGGVLAGKKTTKRSLDEITNELYDKYSTDPNARAIYRNIYDGKKKEDDTPYTMKDWVRDLARPYAPKEGLEVTEESDGRFIFDPNKKSAVTSASKSEGKGLYDDLTPTVKSSFISGESVVKKAGIDPSRFSFKDLVAIGEAKLQDISIDEETGIVTIQERDDLGPTGEEYTIQPLSMEKVEKRAMFNQKSTSDVETLKPSDFGIDTSYIIDSEMKNIPQGESESNKENRTGVYSVREEFEFKDGKKTNKSKGKSYGFSQLYGDAWNSFAADLLGFKSASTMLKQRPELDATNPKNEDAIIDFIESNVSVIGDDGFQQREEKFLFDTKWSKPIIYTENKLDRAISPEVRTWIADAANQHGQVIPEVIDKALEIIDDNSDLDKNNDVDLILALEEARVEYIYNLSGKSITRTEADSIVNNRVKSLTENMINSFTERASQTIQKQPTNNNRSTGIPDYLK